MQWSQHTIADTLQALQAQRQGLDTQTIVLRQKEHGLNKPVRTVERTPLRILREQFVSPLMIVLFLATGVSLVLGELLDFFVVGLALVLNGLLGFVEEYRADASLRALEAYLPIMARVRRNNEIHEVKSEEIVPGDILLLRAGDKVVADARLFIANQLVANEAPLTGESLGIAKHTDVITSHISIGDRANMVFAGTVIAEGMGEAVVVAVGTKTEIGAISTLVQKVVARKTPLQAQISVLAKILTGIVVTATVLVIALGLARGYELGEMLYMGIAIAVSAVPEGLAVATTAILAIGMSRLLKRKVLVRRLVATETLGSVSVVCVDKTGTLTTGEMHVRELLLAPNNEFTESLVGLGWVSNLTYTTDLKHAVTPTERAIGDYYASRTVTPFTRESFTPFSSQMKYSVSISVANGVRYASVVGAPDILATYANMTDDERAWAHTTIESQGKEGRRLVALSMCILEEGADFDIAHTSFVGFMVIEDPVRPSVKAALVRAKEAGLKVIMITGDHPETALSIARELGITDDARSLVTGTALNQMSDAELQQRIHDIRIFARVVPEHKMRIVQALQSAQYVVAMMGDGVNDAPALKAADIGISVGTGTEVAKEASDMVLLETDFARIIEAIFEGRVIFDNIRKVIIFLLITSLTEVFIIAGAVILDLPIPLSPVQLLWINLVADSIPAFALGLEPGERAVLTEGPRAVGRKILSASWYALFFVAGLTSAALLLALYARNLSEGMPVNVASTILFLSLAGIAIFFIFSARVLRVSMLEANPLRNRFILGTVVASVALLLLPFIWPQTREIFGIAPFSFVEWSQVGATIVVAILVLDWLKVRIMKVERQQA